MSGGVDSSMVAHLLVNQGHEVTGITMSIWDGTFYSTGKHACFGPDEKEEIEMAAEICRQLGIPFHVFRCAEQYRETVLKNFRHEYLAGNTPNPCIICNQKIKLALLPGLARKSGLIFDKFATGHYARIGFDNKNKRYLLKKGLDNKKDQSYFLYRLSQQQLSELMFPLGEMTKEEVKNLARSAGLAVADKKESQDFYAGDYKDLLNINEQKGEIVFVDGKKLGEHQGFWNYTIGQRKGLGVAYSEPLYVTAIDSIRNRVIVGTSAHLIRKSFSVHDLNWIATDIIHEPVEAAVKIRSAQREIPAVINPLNDKEVMVTLPAGGDAITPGQSAVFYMQDIVLGGGIINNSIPE